MVFIQGMLKSAQDLCKTLIDCKKKKEPPTMEDIDNWITFAKKTTSVIHKRMFVVMCAQTFGWGFAKELDFYQLSTFKIRSSYITWLYL